MALIRWKKEMSLKAKTIHCFPCFDDEGKFDVV